MFKLRKWLRTTVAAVMTICIMSVAATAYSGAGTVYITSGYLNVRDSGNIYSTVIGKLYSGNPVTISDSSNGWYKVTGNGVTGWVYGKYILDSRAQTVVNVAKQSLGVKYVFGGASPSGFDCSGLTMYAYSKVGVSLIHSAYSQSQQGIWVGRADLKPGDVIFFDTTGAHSKVNHCGIYIGGGMFIQAETGSVQKVVETSLSNSYWSGVYMTARRYIY